MTRRRRSQRERLQFRFSRQQSAIHSPKSQRPSQRTSNAMHDVVQLNSTPSDSAILRRLPHLSPDAMRFVLAVLTYRAVTGRTGIVRASNILRAHGIAVASAVFNELFEAGIIRQSDDSVIVYHPAILMMMAPKSTPCMGGSPAKSNLVNLPIKNRKQRRQRGAA